MNIFNVKVTEPGIIFGQTKQYCDLMDKVDFEGSIYRVINFTQVPGGINEFRARLQELFHDNYRSVGLDQSGNLVWVTLEGQEEFSQEEIEDFTSLGMHEFCKKYNLRS